MTFRKLTSLASSGFSWLARGISAIDTESMEYISSRCLAQAFFGRYHQLPEVVEDARHAYSRTLRMVREMMEARESLHQTTLMLTILTLAIIETVNRTSASAWIMHTQGLAQIIQLRGPRAFHQLPTLAMFEAGRGFIIAEGLVNKHKIFLEDEQWIPRQSTVRARQMKSQLMDILCGLPSLAADLDVSEPAERQGRSGLRSKIVRILDSLFEWRWKWERTHGGCAYQVITDSNLGLNLDENDRPLFPTVFYFSDQLLANEIAHYDAALAFVLRIAQEVLGDSWSSSVNAARPSNPTQLTPTLALPPDTRSASDAMTELFRLIEFHLSGGVGIAGDAYRLLFPLSLAGRGLPQDSDEARRIRRIRSEIADISGFGIFELSLLPEDSI